MADQFFVPYAAPGSKTVQLCQTLLSAGKRVYTFESERESSIAWGHADSSGPLYGVIHRAGAQSDFFIVVSPEEFLKCVPIGNGTSNR